MKNIFTILFATLLISSVGYSQYNYEFKLADLNGLHPKEVLSIISEKIDYSSRHIDKGLFTFESRYNYSEEKFTHIIEESGFEIESFKMFKDVEKIKSL